MKWFQGDRQERIALRNCEYEGLLSEPQNPEEILEIVGFGRFQLKILFLVGLRILAHGSSFALMTVVATSLQCQWSLTNFEKAMLASIFFAGFAIGSFISGFMADKFGRRITMILSFGLSCLLSLSSVFSPNYPCMLVLRFFYGVSVGGVSLGYLFLIEFMPRTFRRIITCMDIFFALGIAYVALLGATVLESVQWRWFVVSAEASPLFMSTLLTVLVPESPRYLIATGRFNEADAVFSSIAKCNKVKGFQARINRNIDTTNSNERKGKVSELFGHKQLWNTLGFMSIWFAVSVGQVGILYQATEYNHIEGTPCHINHKQIFDMRTNLSYHNTTHSTCKPLVLKDYINLLSTGLGGIPGFLVSFFSIESIGRRLTVRILLFLVLLMSSLLFFCLPHWLLAVTFLIGYTSGYTCHLVLQVYVSESYPTYLRGVSNGFIKMFSRFGHITGVLYAQFFLNRSYKISLGIFCAITFMACILTFSLTRETNGEDLYDTEEKPEEDNN